MQSTTDKHSAAVGKEEHGAATKPQAGFKIGDSQRLTGGLCTVPLRFASISAGGGAEGRQPGVPAGRSELDAFQLAWARDRDTWKAPPKDLRRDPKDKIQSGPRCLQRSETIRTAIHNMNA